LSLIIVAAFFPNLWRIEFWGIFLGGLLVCLLGAWDDIRGLGAGTKLPAEILIVLIVYNFGLRIGKISTPFGDSLFLGGLSLPATVLWYVGIMNAFNLSDGLDGLAAGIGCIASVTMFFIGAWTEDITTCILAASVFGMTLGFLKYNFHPAKIFMGDMGSLFLGFLLASVGILGGRKSSTALPLLIPLIALGVSVLDTAIAIVRRIWRGARVFEADREHLHHRLLGLGLSHRQAVLLIYYFCAFLSLAALVLAGLGTRQTALVLMVIAMGVFLAMLALEFIERKVKSSVPQRDTEEPADSYESHEITRRPACHQLLFPPVHGRRIGNHRGPGRGSRTNNGGSTGKRDQRSSHP